MANEQMGGGFNAANMPPVIAEGDQAGLLPETTPGQENISTGSPVDAMNTPEELKKGFEELQARDATLKASEVKSQMDTENMRVETLGALFDIMKKAGVDPNDQDSISEFLDKLYEFDPDLYEIFESAFNNLTGEQSIPPTEGESAPGIASESTTPGIPGMPPASSTTPGIPGMPPTPSSQTNIPMPEAGAPNPKQFGNLTSTLKG